MLSGKTMAMLGVAGLLTMPMTTRAQTGGAGAVTAACGDATIQFSVKLDRRPQPGAVPAGQALVYFIEKDIGVFFPPTMRVSADGRWIGATHGAGYFFVAVEPGVHHLCAMAQSDEPHIALAHFTARAGETYYFEVKAVSGTRGSGALWTDRSLMALDSDEGALLVQDDPYSTARVKK